VFSKILSSKPTGSEAHPSPTPDPAEGMAPSSNLKPSTTTSTIMADLTNSKNTLAADVEIKGSIKFTNELVIDGKVEGEITSSGVLTVGENAEIRGEIKTKSVTVLGKVHGNITVDERCELKSRAVLMGDLKAARLVIEEGATFVGKSEVTPNKVALKQPQTVNPGDAQKLQPAAGGR
jgi:cytoskeletal protein CcmA (bactofilin family)